MQITTAAVSSCHIQKTAFCDTSVVTLVGSVNLGDFNLKMRWSMTVFPQRIRQFMFWGVFWGLSKVIWAEFMGVWALSRHKDNPCLKIFLSNKGKQQCAIWLKQTPSHLGHLGGAQKHIPRKNPYLEGPKVAKMLVLLSCFCFFTGSKILPTQLHSWTAFWHSPIP